MTGANGRATIGPEPCATQLAVTIAPQSWLHDAGRPRDELPGRHYGHKREYDDGDVARTEEPVRPIQASASTNQNDGSVVV